MKWTLLVATLFAVVGLTSLDVPESKVALLRLEPQIMADRWFNDEVAQFCSLLKPATDSPAEKRFIEKLNLSLREPPLECVVRVSEKSSHRFNLRTDWHFAVEISNDSRVVHRHFSVEFPKPLSLLPFAFFLVALVLGSWGIRPLYLFGLHLFVLSGMNPVHAFRLVRDSLSLVLHTDKTLVGLSLLALFLSLYRSRIANAVVPAAAPPEKAWSYFATGLMGLWSPAFFTVFAPLLSLWSKHAGKMKNFFHVQTVILCLSLYLLTVNPRYLADFWDKGVLIPRYFTLAVLLFFIPLIPRGSDPILFWRLPRFFRHLGSVLAVEALTIFWPTLRVLPTLTRIGIVLLVGECLNATPYDRKHFSLHARRSLMVIFAASFLSCLSVQSGLVELSLVIWEPRIHPNGIMLFTFIAGVALGFVTGSVPTTFFALAPLLTKFAQNALVRAALIDGIAAGVLLSPFSIFNLFPSVHYRLRLLNLMALRFRELWIPLAIAAAIYTVSAIPTVAILRPVTFVFLCMVVIALRLKKVDFTLGRFWKEERNDLHST